MNFTLPSINAPLEEDVRLDHLFDSQSIYGENLKNNPGFFYGSAQRLDEVEG